MFKNILSKLCFFIIVQLVFTPFYIRFFIEHAKWPDGNGYIINNIDSIAIDSEGRLYCSVVQFQNLVQVYNRSGQIVNAFEIDTTGDFTLRIVGDKIRVETARGLYRLDYSLDGVLLSKSNVPDGVYAGFYKTKKVNYDGEVYYVRNTPWSSGVKIVRIDKNGKQDVIASTPAIFYYLIGRETSISLLVIIAIYGSILIYKDKKSKHIKRSGKQNILDAC